MGLHRRDPGRHVLLHLLKRGICGSDGYVSDWGLELVRVRPTGYSNAMSQQGIGNVEQSKREGKC